MTRMLKSAAGLGLLTALLASCGGAPQLISDPAPTAARQLVTLKVAPGATEQALRTAFPQADVLALYPASGQALLSMKAQAGPVKAAGLSAASLSALDASVVAVEADEQMAVQATTESMGTLTWAGGLTTWAGGLTTWAGGLPNMTVGTQTELNAYWSKLNLSRAHTLVPEQGLGIRVAVLDTGVDLNHPMLAAQLFVPAYSDYVDGDSAPQEVRPLSGTSYYGHGTGVAGLVLQIAPKATILPYRVLNGNGEGSVSKVVQAMSRAVNEGADVINLSLGNDTDSTAMNNAIADALGRGVMVVNSSGNTGAEGMLYPARNIGSTRFPTTSGLVGVGSVTLGLLKSSFTSYGSNMSLTTPGDQVVTAYPDGGLMKASGTSFSAPAVSGALALAMSAGVTNRVTLATALRGTTSPNLDLVYLGKLGTGTLNVGNFVDSFR